MLWGGVSVNPHYFGSFSKHIRNKICHFIVVGGINPARKNHRLLLEAVEKLLSRGENSFKITVVGRQNKTALPENMRAYFDLTGYVNFPKMFSLMSEADFFLPLLDPENPAHERYITTGVTGSAQLIYGFCKPPIIHEKFATFYGFDEENALIYQDKDLDQAMQRALWLNEHDYALKRDNIEALANKISQESLKNLKGALDA